MKLIKGMGPSSARVAIVGDYATKEEEKVGTGIVGFTERVVNSFLMDQEPDLATRTAACYKTLFIKKNYQGLGAKQVRVREANYKNALKEFNWHEVLVNEMKSVNPNVVIALGEFALRGLTGQTNIHKLRGSILSPDPNLDFPKGMKIIPTLHPRDLITMHHAKVYVTLDYAKALRYQDDPRPFRPDYLVWVCRTLKGLNDFLARQMEKKPPYYSCDIETYLGFITFIGFCFDGEEAISVPLLEHGASNTELAYIYKTIQSVHDSGIPQINQNIKYDKFFQERWGFELPNIAGDTMLAGHTLYPELPKNLGFYTSIYTDIPYFKDEGKNFNPSVNPDQLGLYNAKDCLATWRIYKRMLEDMKELKIYSFYTDKVMPLFHVYCKIDKRGILVDKAQQESLLQKYSIICNRHQSVLDTISGMFLNVNSPKQIGTFIYEDLKCPRHTKKTESGDTSYLTDEDTLEEIFINQLGKDDFKVSVLKEIIAVRKLRKIVQFLEDLKISPDGRLRTTYRLEGTESGRTSGSESYEMDLAVYVKELKTQVKEYLDVIQYGYPFQTLPKHGFRTLEDTEGILGDDLFSMFIPSPGYAFVEGDGSQAEARYVAVLSQDWDTLALMDKTNFQRNKYGLKDDLHTITAMWTTEKPFAEITNFDRQDYGKRPRHAGNYDQTAFGLAKIIHKPEIECTRILNRFHRNAPNLRQVFHRNAREYVEKNGYMVNAYERRRDFFDKRGPNLWRVVYSYDPQSTISDHYKLTLLPLEAEFSEDEARILVEKHDSIMAEVRLDKVKEWATAFKKHAERPIDCNKSCIGNDFQLVIRADICHSAERWSSEMERLEL